MVFAARDGSSRGRTAGERGRVPHLPAKRTRCTTRLGPEGATCFLQRVRHNSEVQWWVGHSCQVSPEMKEVETVRSSAAKV